MHLDLVRLALLGISTAAIVPAQHCGGICERPWITDPVCPNPVYTLSEGTGGHPWQADWYWTEHGEQKHELAAAFGKPPLLDFGRRQVFVSPAGNGFLVTGNPYAVADRLTGRDPPLLVFCSPTGQQLAEYSLPQLLTDDERRLGRCPYCNCCKDVIYVFAQDPALSPDGCFVELRKCETNWPVHFFLPWACVVRDRPAFEAALEAAEWAALDTAGFEREHQQIAIELRALDSSDLTTRTQAATALIAKGFLARSALRTARAGSNSGNFRARAKAVEAQLRPLASAPWEQLPRDLSLLASLLTFEEPDVVKAIQTRLHHIVPQVAGMDVDHCAAWIKQHRSELTWNAAKGHYEQ